MNVVLKFRFGTVGKIQGNRREEVEIMEDGQSDLVKKVAKVA